MEKRKFWVFQRGDPEKGETVLRLDGPIAKESWFGDEVMLPRMWLGGLLIVAASLLEALGGDGGAPMQSPLSPASSKESA